METGTKINQYKIISPIGKGGMGEVFLAQDTKLNRKVAIKFLNEECSRDAEKLNRFTQEAQATSALNHPNILTIYEIGEADGKNYIATEFIEGKTLREQLSPKKTISLNQILKIGVQVAEALAAAHQAGIIHRDIKPENIMIRQDGYAKVLDFGLAKLTEKQRGEAQTRGHGEEEDTLRQPEIQNLTAPGMVMGTVSYMSPEQARGKETDARTDIWSLGVVLYEMLSGEVPFTGETISHTIVAILEKEPLLLENVPDELHRIIRKSLTKDADMRYQSSKDLLIDLKNLRRAMDIQGELDRSIVPDREATTNQVQENPTQIYNERSTEEARADDAKPTQNVKTASSLEYAVAQAKTHKLATAVIGIVLLSFISAIAYFRYFPKTKQINSIAVLPFENRNSDADTDYLSDGLAESVIFRLTQIPDLKVSPTSSVMRYKGASTDIARIANELGVDAVMTGRLTKRGENLNITVELVDAGTNKSLWGEQYERKLSELLTTQREIVGEIVGKLQLKLSGESENRLAKKYTDNNEAYQLYLQGRYHWNQRTSADFEKAVVFFKKAVEKDPNYALAYAGLADTYALFPDWVNGRPRVFMPQAKQAALKALELDPDLAEAHASLGLITFYYDYDLAGAERSYKRAIELNPKYPSAHQWYGGLLNAQGRLEEGLRETSKAAELDPYSKIIIWNLGDAFQFNGQYDEAIRQYQKLIELFSDQRINGDIGNAYAAQRKYQQAVEAFLDEYRYSQEVKPDEIQKLKTSFDQGGWEGFGRAKQETDLSLLKARQAKNPDAYIKPYEIAKAYCWGRDKDKVIEYLNKAYEERSADVLRLRTEFPFAVMRDDPRFKELLRKVGIPE